MTRRKILEHMEFNSLLLVFAASSASALSTSSGMVMFMAGSPNALPSTGTVLSTGAHAVFAMLLATSAAASTPIFASASASTPMLARAAESKLGFGTVIGTEIGPAVSPGKTAAITGPLTRVPLDDDFFFFFDGGGRLAISLA